ncbi:hypothetical protein [Pontibacter anaerobius]|uniref:TonB-dependent receptor n=1 Tax=Pontibacter anaerobius TaxID=2993940 RepID=A0ABT3RCR8_9BACT|nr:hypothetical protein [Pontibacter anaerobius]MCX2739565.1 hypothetical protein [Pontibacter anaerobius]
MKSYFLSALIGLCLVTSVQAQQLDFQRQEVLSTYDQPQPLVLVNQQETTTNAIILNPNDIESVEVVKGANAL